MSADRSISGSRSRLRRTGLPCLLLGIPWVLAGCGNSSPGDTYSLSGTIAGLSSYGLVLGVSGGPSTTLFTTPGQTRFDFGPVLAPGDAFTVTVLQQPTAQTCHVTNGMGAQVQANVSNVVVTCIDSAHTLSGTISGLTAVGLMLTGQGTSLTIDANASTFSFGAVLTSGSIYSVSVASAPTGMTCSVANGVGTAGSSSINNVAVTCSDKAYTLGGAITGLDGSGLVLANGTTQVTVASGSSAFMLPGVLAYDSAYAVSIVTQPTGVNCTVSNGSGTMPAANVGNIAVTCSNLAYPLGGSITGLSVGGFVLGNGNNQVTLSANASSFTLPTAVAYSSAYAVTVATQPVGLTCTVSNGTGTMPASNVTSVTVACADNAYTLGGAISGLTTGGLVLKNGSDRLTVAAGAAQFTMPTAVAYTSSYAVAVAMQPSGLTCTVTNGAGTMPASLVTSVLVACATREWTWESGPANTPNAAGIYGIQGTAAANNMPGSRDDPASWADTAGNLWLYGGYSYNVSDTQGVQEDLWRYSLSTGEWTWMGGSSTNLTAAPVYGTQGIAAANNSPGARENAASWSDSAGNLWLFGGDGNSISYSDLWMYSPVTGLWTWVSGSNVGGAAGVYGTQGTAAAGNMPSARAQLVSWVDSAGNFWFFGGYGPGGTLLNDLWRYSPASGQWTWMSGSSTTGASGIYGTKGIVAAGNVPGARATAISWTDSAGNLWLFGGIGFDSNGTGSNLNDLWRYSPASGQWSWVSGASTVNQNGTYGAKGTAAAGNVPGARQHAIAWADSVGNLWLFGGVGVDSVGSYNPLNDLWEYTPSSNEWTWVSGANTVYAVAVYGTQGTPAAGNVSGALLYMVPFTDQQGNFWMFGGYGNAAITSGTLNTLWRY